MLLLLILVLPALALATAGLPFRPLSNLLSTIPADQYDSEASAAYVQTLNDAKAAGTLLPQSHPLIVKLLGFLQEMKPLLPAYNPRVANWKFEVNAIQSSEINAYCMAGGKIMFYTGLNDTLHLTDDELFFVLAHETGHAVREHSRTDAAKGTIMDQINDELLKSFGDDSTNISPIAVSKNVLIEKFSRDDESEADAFGAEIMAKVGRNPAAGCVLLLKLGTLETPSDLKTEWFATHPVSARRAADCQKYLAPLKNLSSQASHLKGLISSGQKEKAAAVQKTLTAVNIPPSASSATKLKSFKAILHQIKKSFKSLLKN